MKPPASTRTVNEMPEIVVASRTLAHDATGLLVLPPRFHIDPRLSIERRNHDISRLAVAFRMIVIARAFQANVAKCMRQRRIAKGYKGWVVHWCLLREIHFVSGAAFRLCVCAGA